MILALWENNHEIMDLYFFFNFIFSPDLMKRDYKYDLLNGNQEFKNTLEYYSNQNGVISYI